MLTRSETEDLKTSLLKQCPGPLMCQCKFCKTRTVIAAYERVAAFAEVLDETEPGITGAHYVARAIAAQLRKTLDGV